MFLFEEEKKLKEIPPPALSLSLSFIFYMPIKFQPLIKIRNFLRLDTQQFGEWMSERERERKRTFSCESKINQIELVKFFFPSSNDIDCIGYNKNEREKVLLLNVSIDVFHFSSYHRRVCVCDERNSKENVSRNELIRKSNISICHWRAWWLERISFWEIEFIKAKFEVILLRKSLKLHNGALTFFLQVKIIKISRHFISQTFVILIDFKLH